jgi:hypothetical protein
MLDTFIVCNSPGPIREFPSDRGGKSFRIRIFRGRFGLNTTHLTSAKGAASAAIIHVNSDDQIEVPMHVGPGKPW